MKTPAFNLRVQMGTALAFILAAGLLYARVLPAYFLADDYLLLVRLFIQGFYSSWGPHPGGFFRPVTVFFYWLDLKLWGLHPIGFHAVSIFFHGLAAWLMAGWSRDCLRFFKLSGPRAVEAAWWAGIFFLVWPNRIEAVSYIAARNDLLAVVFSLIALRAGLAYLRAPRAWKLGIGMAGLSAALLSKESALAAVPVLAAFCLLVLRREDQLPAAKIAARRLLPFASGVLLLYLALRVYVLGTPFGGYGAAVHLNPFSMLFHLSEFSFRSLVPALPVAWQPLLPGWAWTLLEISFLFSMVIFGWRRLASSLAASHLGLGILLASGFLLSLFPVLGMQPPSLFGPEGERLLYFPSIFVFPALALAGGFFISNPTHRFRAGIGLTATAALCLLGGQTRWVEAGNLAQRVLSATARQITQPRVVALTVPDSYQGVLVFRLGFTPGLMLFQKQTLFERLRDVKDDLWVKRTQEIWREMARLQQGLPAQAPLPALLPLQTELGTLQSMESVQAYLADLRAFQALQAVKEVQCLSACRVQTPEDEVRMSYRGDAAELETLGPGRNFSWIDPLPAWPVSRLTLQKIRLPRASLQASGTDLLYYSRGDMRRPPASGPDPGAPSSAP